MAIPLPALSMSQTKDDLLKHLNLPPETYTQMAKEADVVYRWLTEDKRHLRDKTSRRKPPYDWSDIVEKSKDEAMTRIAESGDQYTDYYWKLGEGASDCPNWVARWFLYHKFRYRDGRNRNTTKSEDGKHSNHHRSSKHSHSGKSSSKEYNEGYSDSQSYYGSTNTQSGSESYMPPEASSSTGYAAYNSNNNNYYTGGASGYGYDTEASKTYYDPVRDSRT